MEFIAIIASIAAVISTYIAYKNWRKMVEISKATLSLTPRCNLNFDKSGQVSNVDWSFDFKNVGREEAILLRLDAMYVQVINKKPQPFKSISVRQSVPAEQTFSYKINLTMPGVKDVSRIGDHAVIIAIKYIGKGFRKKEIGRKYHLVYNGRDIVAMTDNIYEKIKDVLPENFERTEE